MSSFVAATVVLAGAAAYTANEARLARGDAKVARKDAEATAQRIRDDEKKKQDAIDAEVAAEKKSANYKALERMRRKGHGGTVLTGGKSEAPTLLGSVG